MNIYYLADLSTEERRRLLRRRRRSEKDVVDAVGRICEDVKRRGDVALLDHTERFDGVRIETIRVGEEEFEDACRTVPKDVRAAIVTAAGNIGRFHAAQLGVEPEVETMPGVRCWREPRPIERVGLYVPAGSAPLPSTVLMLAVPARLAGCDRVMLCSPPNRSGRVDPAVLVAARIVGVEEVYRVGGAQAIAAMAYGTGSIEKVDKVFGPGNRYVTAAKTYVASDPDGASVDLLAGPSELLVIADGYADPRLVAADLLSQAEHDDDAHVALVTDSLPLAEQVVSILRELLCDLPRRSIAERSLQRSFAIVTPSLADAVEVANDYGPEHLNINTVDPVRLVPNVRNVGSVFLGAFAPVTAGDYASGTNHTLPTSGTARWSGGVSVDSFRTMVSFQSLTRDGLELLAPTLITLARAEGLEAHARAVTARFVEGNVA